MMNTILAGLTWQGARCYIDDVNCYTKMFNEHLEILDKTSSRFAKAGLTLKISKCCFAASKVELLGHRPNDPTVPPPKNGIVKNWEFDLRGRNLKA